MMQIFQFAFGGLVPGDTLRMIEEATMHEPVMLQESFNAYEECSQISMNDCLDMPFVRFSKKH
jgi:hypothetical protein